MKVLSKEHLYLKTYFFILYLSYYFHTCNFSLYEVKFSMAYAAMIAKLVTIIVSMISKYWNETKDFIVLLTDTKDLVINSLEAGFKYTLSVGITCGVAGIIACLLLLQ